MNRQMFPIYPSDQSMAQNVFYHLTSDDSIHHFSCFLRRDSEYVSAGSSATVQLVSELNLERSRRKGLLFFIKQPNELIAQVLTHIG